jgi:hypothetical protein
MVTLSRNIWHFGPRKKEEESRYGKKNQFCQLDL